MGFAAQTTYWSAVDLHKAVMTNTCAALNRPIREPHPEVAGAVAANLDLLLSGVAVDEHARVTIENEACKLYEASLWAADKRAAEIVLARWCSRLTESHPKKPGAGHGVR